MKAPRLPLAMALIAGLVHGQETGRLRVATYNVENLFDNFDDPYRPDEGTSPKNAWDMRVLAKTLDSIDADVVALQEVENIGIARRLNRQLAKPYAFVEFLTSNDMRGIRCGLFSRVRIKQASGHRFWPLAGGKRFARDFPVFELEPSRGRSLFVAPVHLKSKRTVDRGDAQSAAWRGAEARGILEVLARLRKTRQEPFVVLGDFNDTPDAHTLAPLFGALTDATAGVAAADRYSYIFGGRRQQIDHVLFDGDLGVAKARFIHDATGASDHHPLVVEFTWPSRVRKVAGPERRELEPRRRRPQVDAGDLAALKRLLLRPVAVVGTIAAVRPTRRGGHVNITFAKDARKAVTAFVPRDAVARFGDLAKLVGKRVRIEGPLFVYRGRYEIQLTRKAQLNRL